MRIACLGTLAASFLVLPSLDAAQAERARAEMVLTRDAGTDSCIGREGLERAVEKRLRREVFLGTPGLRVEVALSRDGERFKAELVLRTAQGQELGRRVLQTEANDCSALDASLALVVALLVDSPPSPEPPPESTSAEPPVAPVQPPAPEAPAAARAPTPIELPRDTHAPREPWRFEPAVSFAAALDRLPGFAFGPRLALGIRPPRFPEFRVAAGGLFPRERTLEAAQGAARFSLLDVSLELCPLELEQGSSRVSACLGQSIGRLGVTGLGFDRNEEQARLDVLISAGVAYWFFFGRPFGVRLALGAGFPLTRDAYVARSEEGGRLELWRRGIVVGMGEVSLGAEL